MKKIPLFFLLLLGVVAAQAREPYGDYICRYIVEGGRYCAHNFSLTNQHVVFSISDHPCANYNGKKYYAINSDGQWQLAETRY